ncbi:MAG: hypothetical protein KJ990_12480 [Proteobacteria bacterium]|nr:hypothetical protein [Pseudomonadota bacterium]MBU1648246.1 hypothetical protein [Pseudomonadota bacterium]MBU1986140.1 hypothetical protein [Pseudomonadota bacterium]
MRFALADLTAFFGAVAGMNDQVKPTEEIFITTCPAPVAICYRCHGQVGYVKDAGRPADLHNLAPLAGGKKPAWSCPHCDQDIRVWLPTGAAIKTTIGVLPC